MNNFNVLRSNSKGFGANVTDFYSGQIHNLDRLVDSKNYDNTIINPDDIVLGTSDLTKNSVISKQNLGPYKYTYHNDSLRTIFDDKHASDNAVKQIETSSTDINQYGQKLTYTSFNSVKTIVDTVYKQVINGGYTGVCTVLKQELYYGSDGQRVLMVSKRNDTITAKKYYFGEYEYTVYPSPAPAKEVTYISAPTGLVSAQVKIGNVSNYYYILTDHLSSITQLLKSNGDTVGNARFTYDAWGRLRDVRSPNPYMIGNAQTTAFHILDRGYCGHEHLLDHGIINMNGRIYDPITAQFMQADNYIQTPEDYIGYNRYSYCRHNPFKYTDPSGEQYLAGSGGGGVMAAVGAAIQAAEEQAQNAMAMALGAAMQNWNPNATRHGIEQLNRLKQKFSHGGGKEKNIVTPPNKKKETKPTSETGTNDISQQRKIRNDRTSGIGTSGDENKENNQGEDGSKPYKQYPIPKTADGNYDVPNKATAANLSPDNAYYRPEETADDGYNEDYYIKPGYYIMGEIDGLATDYSDHLVYKVPDGIQAIIMGNGDVRLVKAPFFYDDIKIAFKSGYTHYIKGYDYEYGWMSTDSFSKINALGGWQVLFNLARNGGR